MRYKIVVYTRNIQVVDGLAQEIGRVQKNVLYADTIDQARTMREAIEMVPNTEGEILARLYIGGQIVCVPPDMVQQVAESVMAEAERYKFELSQRHAKIAT